MNDIGYKEVLHATRIELQPTSRREKKTRDTRRPGEGRHQPSEPGRGWEARCRQCVEPGWLDRDVPAPKQGKRQPVESGSRLALGPDLKRVFNEQRFLERMIGSCLRRTFEIVY